jgi:hypothetical protein
MLKNHQTQSAVTEGLLRVSRVVGRVLAHHHLTHRHAQLLSQVKKASVQGKIDMFVRASCEHGAQIFLVEKVHGDSPKKHLRDGRLSLMNVPCLVGFIWNGILSSIGPSSFMGFTTATP